MDNRFKENTSRSYALANLSINKLHGYLNALWLIAANPLPSPGAQSSNLAACFLDGLFWRPD